MTAWTVAIALALALFVGAGIGIRWERRHQARRRGGMLPAPTPRAVVDRWNFPAAPKVYDHERDGEPLASVGHPLIPDVHTLADAMDAAYTHDPHSRRVGP